jgi:patatin-like phospholipase/acyl hydrolase
VKILSLCGGGTSGYMTVGILNKIEKEFKIEIKKEFDLVGGVSTGSIIGAMLDSYYLEEIKEKYKELQSVVFGHKRNFFMSLFFPLYNIDDLYYSAVDVFQFKLIQEISNFKFLAYALELNNSVLGPKFFKSWENDTKYFIQDVVTASSCIPVAFKPFELNGKLYFDGGIIRNNPTMCIVADALKLGTPLEDIKCLTIETDYHKGFNDPKKLIGLFKLSKTFSMLAIDGGERVSSYVSDKILKNNLVDVIPDVYFNTESSDWKTMDEIIDVTWNTYKGKIEKLLL